MEVVDLSRGRRVAGLLPAGTRLGRYEVVRLLSVGGMAEIYLARAEGIAGFEKRVVLKRMLPHFAIQPDYVRMFLAEARLAARLEHPNIVSVHDIGEETGNYHYAMEYVRGGDLRELLRAVARAGEHVPLGVAVGIILGVCAGLDHAHNITDGDGRSFEVVYRDVSLSNVLVSFEGAVKVTDFGVAKMDEADRRTRTGTLKGKVAYMSPEQCRGMALDRRSDVFAIGILLYELITCRRLFAGGGELVTLQRIVREDAPAPSRYRPTCPVALDEIVARALARDRGRRYQTARELGHDLEALARTERFATSSSEIAAFTCRLIGGPATPSGLAVASDTQTFDASSGNGDDGDEGPIVSAEIVPYESAPVAAAPDVQPPPPRKATLHASATNRWDMYVRLGSLALVLAALLTVFFWRARPAPPPTRPPAVGSFAPPPAEMRPPAVATKPAEPPPVPARALKPEPEPEPETESETETETEPETESVKRPARSEDGTRRRNAVDRFTRRRDLDRRTSGRRGENLPRISVDRGDDRAVADEAFRDPNTPDAAPPPTESPPPASRPLSVVSRQPTSVSRPPPTDSPKTASRSPPLPPSLAPPPDDAPPATSSYDAAAALSRVEVTGPLQTSELLRALERVLPAVRACYRTAATRARRSQRLDVRVSFEIDDTRTARDVRAASAPLPGLSACVAGAIGRARTRVAPDVGNAEVSVTITFTPLSP